MPTHILVYYNEITLKGNNRDMFEKKLLENISASLAYHFPGLVSSTKRDYGRIIFSVQKIDPNTYTLIAKVLGDIPGIGAFSFAQETKKDTDALNALALDVARHAHFETFCILTRRSDKTFPLTSPEVNTLVGAHVGSATKKKVDIKNADLTIHIDITKDAAFIYDKKFPGVGGLPVGTGGRAALLLSGGIDSPVAGFYIAKRGVDLCAVHFHASPYTSRASIDKARALASELARFTGHIKLFIVPLADIQRTIAKDCPENLRVLLYRRFMMRITNKIAENEHAQAVITGESLGQVASQTIENLRVTEDASALPVFRPLIGFDKQEIIAKAEAIGTLAISLQPHEDCCTLFVPKHPRTKARIGELVSAEQALNIPTLVENALNTLSVEIRYPEKTPTAKAQIPHVW